MYEHCIWNIWKPHDKCDMSSRSIDTGYNYEVDITTLLILSARLLPGPIIINNKTTKDTL